MKSTDMRRKRSLKVSGAHPMETLDIPQPMPQEARKDTKEREEACREAILRVFLETTNMIAYRYEVAKDETTLWQAAPGEEMKDAHRANFYDYFPNEVLADADQSEEVLARLTDACRRIRDDVVEYRVKTKDGSPLWRRTSYHSLATEDGQVYAVVGLMEDLHDTTHMMERQEAQLKRDPQTRLFDREGLALLINHQLMNLLRGEKGVLFIVGIDDYEKLCEALGESACNGYIGTLSDSVRADFRGVDIFGRVKRDEIAVFISGRISIDIIEKRAQRILDLFLRVQPQDHTPVSFSMGISVTGSPTETFDHMVSEAEEAMLSARRFGPNRCRMYDEIKG